MRCPVALQGRVAESRGFEPLGGVTPTRLPNGCIRPLCQLSIIQAGQGDLSGVSGRLEGGTRTHTSV